MFIVELISFPYRFVKQYGCNPTGATTSLARRQEVLDISRKHNILILEGFVPKLSVNQRIQTCFISRRSLLLHVLRHAAAHPVVLRARGPNRGPQRRARAALRQLQQDHLRWHPHRLRDGAHDAARRH